VSTPEIKAGACYRDTVGGSEVVRAILQASPSTPNVWDCLVIVPYRDATPGTDTGRVVTRNLRGYERVPDPTPAVIDDEPAHDEAARQERVPDPTPAVMSLVLLARFQHVVESRGRRARGRARAVHRETKGRCEVIRVVLPAPTRARFVCWLLGHTWKADTSIVGYGDRYVCTRCNALGAA
jgi:hypothetical protein